MKRLIGLIAVLFLLGTPAFAQQITPPIGESFHLSEGVYYAPVYSLWQARIVSGNSATGAGATIVVSAPAALPDGYSVPLTSLFPTASPFVPVSLIDSLSETFTPTAVSIGACPSGAAGPIGSQCATLTGSITNLHGASAIVTSGDSGIMEAITDAAAAGGGLVYWATDTGIVTLNTGGLTTTTTAFVPTNFISFGAAARVTTTITTSTAWLVGISGTTNAFCTSNATLTAGTTCIANINSPARVGTTNALTAILFTATVSNPGAGAIKARIWGFTPVQSSN